MLNISEYRKHIDNLPSFNDIEPLTQQLGSEEVLTIFRRLT